MRRCGYSLTECPELMKFEEARGWLRCVGGFFLFVGTLVKIEEIRMWFDYCLKDKTELTVTPLSDHIRLKFIDGGWGVHGYYIFFHPQERETVVNLFKSIG